MPYVLTALVVVLYATSLIVLAILVSADGTSDSWSGLLWNSLTALGDRADRGVVPAPVVAVLDSGPDSEAGFGPGWPVPALVELGLQSGPERFRGGVVPAHAGAYRRAQHGQIGANVGNLLKRCTAYRDRKVRSRLRCPLSARGERRGHKRGSSLGRSGTSQTDGRKDHAVDQRHQERAVDGLPQDQDAVGRHRRCDQ